MEEFHFGENLRDMRESKRIKQLAVATKLGISQPTYSRIEAEPTPCDYLQIEIMSEFFNEPIKAFFTKWTDVVNEPIIAAPPAQEPITNEIKFLKSALGKVLVFAGASVLAGVVYEIIKAFFLDMGVSDDTRKPIQTIFGLSVYVIIYHLWKRHVNK